MAADYSQFPDGRDTESDCRTIEMESPIIRHTQQVNLTERGRLIRHLRFDHISDSRFVLEGKERRQNREAPGSAQISFRCDVEM